MQPREVLEGEDKLSPRTETEERRGKNKPENYRMACQTFVNGDTSVVVKSLDK